MEFQIEEFATVIMRLCVHDVGKHKQTRLALPSPPGGAGVSAAKHMENISCLLRCRPDSVPAGTNAMTAVRGLKDGIHRIPKFDFIIKETLTTKKRGSSC